MGTPHRFKATRVTVGREPARHANHMTTAAVAAASKRAHPALRRAVRGAGWTLVAAGALVLYFLVYQLVGTNAITAQAQRHLVTQLRHAWHQPAAQTPARPVLGQPFAVIDIPKLQLEEVLIYGVRPQDLRKGPGHEPWTAMPGQAGTFGVSGHRTTFLAPFFYLNHLTAGNEVKIITSTHVYTYAVTTSRVVSPSDGAVMNAVRGPGGGLEHLIALTTCTPLYSAAQRLVVFGRLVAVGANNGAVAA